MTNIVTLKKATRESLGLIGKKAVMLALLSQQFKVPPAFIVTKTAIGLILKPVEKQVEEFLKTDSERCGVIAEQLQNEILQTEIPEELKEEIHDAYFSLNIEEGQSLNDLMKQGEEPIVAVRHGNSNGAPYNTILGVQGMKALEHAIKACIASVYSAEALEYRGETKKEQGNFAVIIQRMIDATASGIMHTSYKMNEEEVLIFGCKGLGTALESGLIQPDKYFITKKTLSLAAVELGKQPFMLERDFETNTIAKIYLQEEYSKKQKIPDRHLGELTLMSREIEKMFGKPQEISFGISKEALFFFGAKEAGWHKEMQKSEVPKTMRVQKIMEQTKEEIEKKEEEISAHITEELNHDTLVARALSETENPQQEEGAIDAEQQLNPINSTGASYDPNDINSVVLSIDFNALVEETRHVVEQQQKPSSSIILPEQKTTAEIMTEPLSEDVGEQEGEDAVEEITRIGARNEMPLSAIEKTAGEIIIHCFKELKAITPQEQWSSSPELRHVAVLAQNFSQKNVAPTALQVKFAMDAVERLKSRER